MVKTYLRYAPSGVVGVITSCASVYDKSGDLAICGALENVSIWNLRKSEIAFMMKDENAKTEILAIAKHPISDQIATGYADGSIRVWDLKQRRCVFTLNGHKSGVTVLKFNKTGNWLASGSQDTTIIVWDVLAESGLYRLKGHKNMITDIIFWESKKKIISSSKDTLIKIWDPELQHCVQTLVGHRHEVWSLALDHKENRLVAGSLDHQLKVWSLNPEEFENLERELELPENPLSANNEDDSKDEESENPNLVAKFLGPIDRTASKERVSMIRFDQNGSLLAVQAADHTIECYEMFSTETMELRRKKRLKRLKKKQKEDSEPVDSAPYSIKDEFLQKFVMYATAKIKYFDFHPTAKQILCTLMNNQLEVLEYTMEAASYLFSVATPGHRNDIRDLSLSSDDSLLLSISNGLAKIWNTKTLRCIRTFKCGYGLCGMFVPGNRHVIIGTKSGTLELHEIASGALLETVQAHKGAVWSMATKIDKTGIVTGGADKFLHFWDFQLARKVDEISPEISKKEKDDKIALTLTIKQMTSAQMTDDVLCVRYSPNGKLLAVALLDNTVKIFFAEDLKFYLSLYGHKLPVMSMDISFDSYLITTVSADKNVRIWGLDFGDCHKSIFGHDDSITQVKFVQNTHYFFTCSKDKTVKYWDADKFENIQILSGHQSHVWCLAVSTAGDYIVTGSADKSLRFWNKTDEQIFVEEEKLNAMDLMMEQTVLQNVQHDEDTMAKRTLKTIKSTERLLEALELADQELQKTILYEEELSQIIASMTKEEVEKKGKENILKPPQPSFLLMGSTPSQYVLKRLKEIPPGDLEEAMMILPFRAVSSFFRYIKDWLITGVNLELSCRCLLFLVKVHQNQISNNKEMQELIEFFQKNLQSQLQRAKDLIGFNKAAMNFLKRSIELETNSEFFENVEKSSTKKKSKKNKGTQQ